MARKTVTPGARAPLDEAAISELAAESFEPVLSLADIDHYDTEMAPEMDRRRRLTLAILTRSRDELVSGFAGDDGFEALDEALRQVTVWSDHCKRAAEAADAVVARLLLVMAALAATPPNASRQVRPSR